RRFGCSRSKANRLLIRRHRPRRSGSGQDEATDTRARNSRQRDCSRMHIMAQTIGSRRACDSTDLMNPEFPPIQISEPRISSRRREKPPFIKLPAVAVAERTDKCRLLRAEVAEI